MGRVEDRVGLGARNPANGVDWAGDMTSAEKTALVAAIAEDLPCGVWVASAPDGRFVYSNSAFEEIMGMGPVPEAGVGEYSAPYGIFSRDGRPYPEHQLPFVRALHARQTVVVDDIVIHRRDGRRVYVRAFGKPIFDAAGEIAHIAIAFFDITREVEARDAQQRMQLQLAQTERLASVGMLAAAVAHEVNNPLSYVIGSLDLLDRDLAAAGGMPTPDQLRAIHERIQDARQGASRVRAIVRDLKVFSRVNEERPTTVDVRTPLQAALVMANNEIRHRARLATDLQPVPHVWCDEGRLGQIFLNLLINAAQAIPEGAVEKNEIRVATSATPDDWVRVEIRDTGSGIAPDVVSRIFEPFFTTKPAGFGTGLGLTICQNIVTQLGGRIEVDSRVGEGTSFRVILPPASRTATGHPKAGPAHRRAVRRGAVLVVDDEPLLLKVVAQMLSPGHDVTCEGTAGAALERIRHGERFDAIICDIMMPHMTGMDLYDKVLEVAPKQAQSMLFLTGGAFTAAARAFLDRVPNATVEKPFDAATLLARVQQLIT